MHCHPVACVAFVFLVPLLPLPAQSLIQNVFGTEPRGELGRAVRAVGDLDGDGVGDFAVSQPEGSAGGGTLPGRVFLVSGASRATLRTIVGSPVGFNRDFGYHGAMPLGDVDGDGRPDLAIGYGGVGPLDVFSGATGLRLYRLASLEYRQLACGIGDLDGDQRDDFAVAVNIGSTTQLWLVKGNTGASLGVLAASVAPPTSLLALGDVNGDGRPEVAYHNANEIRIYQVSPPQLLRTIQRPSGVGNLRRIAAADVTGDGVAEVLTADDLGVYAFHPLTGAVLRTYLEPRGASFDGRFAVVDDLDGDGGPELVLAVGDASTGEVVFVSTSHGRRVSVWASTPQFSVGYAALEGLGDIDGDGFGDLVVGNRLLAGNTGGWQVVSGRVVATTQSLPANCGGGPFLPQLGITRPIIGQAVTLVGRDCPPAAFGTVALSAQPLVATNLGVAGCDAWFDLGNWVILHRPPPGPTWTHTVPIPNAAQFAGLEVALQAFYLPTAGPLGYDLSNGIWARFGW